MQDWNGAAADAFKNNFLGRFGKVATNQFLLLGVVKGGLEAEKAVWQGARQDIDHIAHATMDALENLHSCGKNEVSFALSVLGAVGAITAIPFTLGASAIAISAVGAAAALGTAAQDATKVTGGGSTPEQVIQSMKSAIDKLTGEIQGQRDKTAKALNDYTGAIEQHTGGDRSPFVTPRPKLATLEGQQLTSHKGMGTFG